MNTIPHRRNRIRVQARADTPLGPVTLAATAEGLAGLWFDGQAHHPGVIDAPSDSEDPHITQALRELDAYWHGDAMRFDVPLDPFGTPFQRRVWAALRRIARGRTTTYGSIAKEIAGLSLTETAREMGSTGAAARAVGAAVGRNPISVIVPCHRVIGSDGTLTGYAGGLDRKRALLRLEGVLRPETQTALPLEATAEAVR